MNFLGSYGFKSHRIRCSFFFVAIVAIELKDKYHGDGCAMHVTLHAACFSLS